MHVGQEAMSWMFAPWKSQKSVRKHKDPITGNSFIDVSQHVDRALLHISADTQLLCLLLVSVDTRLTDAFSTRDWLLWTTRRQDMSRTKNCHGFRLMSQKILRFFQGHERTDKANRSRARAAQEPDNAEYLYTF